jgi:hypothetical protein
VEASGHVKSFAHVRQDKQRLTSGSGHRAHKALTANSGLAATNS